MKFSLVNSVNRDFLASSRRRGEKKSTRESGKARTEYIVLIVASVGEIEIILSPGLFKNFIYGSAKLCESVFEFLSPYVRVRL